MFWAKHPFSAMEREQTVVIGAMPLELQMTSADPVPTGGGARCSPEFAGCQRVILPFGEGILVVLEFGCCECGEHASVHVARMVRVYGVAPTAESEGRIKMNTRRHLLIPSSCLDSIRKTEGRLATSGLPESTAEGPTENMRKLVRDRGDCANAESPQSVTRKQQQ